MTVGVLVQFLLAVLVATDAPIAYILLAYAAVRSSLVMGRPAFSAMVADIAPSAHLAENYGILRVGQNAGWAAGPAIGGYLLSVQSYSWLFAAAGLMGVVTLAVVFSRLRESSTRKGGAEVSLGSLFSGSVSRSFILFIAVSLLIFAVMGQLGSTLSVFTVDRAGFSTGQYGLLLTLNGLIVVLLQYPVTMALRRVGASAALAGGCCLYAAGYLAMSWVGSFGVAAGAIAVITLGEIVTAPTSLAVAGELSPPAWRGRYMGLYGLSETAGMALGPLLGGVLLDYFPSQPLFVWGPIALLALLAAIGFSLWNRAVAPQQRIPSIDNAA